jgi:hypothetical protein
VSSGESTRLKLRVAAYCHAHRRRRQQAALPAELTLSHATPNALDVLVPTERRVPTGAARALAIAPRRSGGSSPAPLGLRCHLSDQLTALVLVLTRRRTGAGASDTAAPNVCPECVTRASTRTDSPSRPPHALSQATRKHWALGLAVVRWRWTRALGPPA